MTPSRSTFFLLLALLSSSACEPDSVNPTYGPTGPEGVAGDFHANEQEARLVALISEYRRASLTRCAALDAAAQRHSRDMAAHGFVGHTGTDGSHVDDRACEAGYTQACSPLSTSVGENAFVGSRDANDCFSAWRNSPTHDEVMRSPLFTAVGVAQVDGSWTAVFAGDSSCERSGDKGLGGEGTSFSSDVTVVLDVPRADAVVTGTFDVIGRVTAGGPMERVTVAVAWGAESTNVVVCDDCGQDRTFSARIDPGGHGVPHGTLLSVAVWVRNAAGISTAYSERFVTWHSGLSNGSGSESCAQARCAGSDAIWWCDGGREIYTDCASVCRRDFGLTSDGCEWFADGSVGPSYYCSCVPEEPRCDRNDCAGYDTLAWCRDGQVDLVSCTTECESNGDVSLGCGWGTHDVHGDDYYCICSR